MTVVQKKVGKLGVVGGLKNWNFIKLARNFVEHVFFIRRQNFMQILKILGTDAIQLQIFTVFYLKNAMLVEQKLCPS